MEARCVQRLSDLEPRGNLRSLHAYNFLANKLFALCEKNIELSKLLMVQIPFDK